MRVIDGGQEKIVSVQGPIVKEFVGKGPTKQSIVPQKGMPENEFIPLNITQDKTKDKQSTWNKITNWTLTRRQKGRDAVVDPVRTEGTGIVKAVKKDIGLLKDEAVNTGKTVKKGIERQRDFFSEAADQERKELRKQSIVPERYPKKDTKAEGQISTETKGYTKNLQDLTAKKEKDALRNEVKEAKHTVGRKRVGSVIGTLGAAVSPGVKVAKEVGGLAKAEHEKSPIFKTRKWTKKKRKNAVKKASKFLDEHRIADDWRRERREKKQKRKERRRETAKKVTDPVVKPTKKYTEASGYKEGKEIGKERVKKTKNFLKKKTGVAGRFVLGEERFDKYKNKAFQRKKRLKKQVAFAKKHPYKAAGIGSIRGAKASLKIGGKTAKHVNKLAANKASAAAKLIVERDGLLAIFKPLYWALRLNALFASHPQPYIITGLAFFSIFAVWYFGSFSGMYALFAFRAMIAGIVNSVFSVANAFIFGINGLLSLVQLGIITIINQIGYFFTGGIIDFINNITQTLSFLPGFDGAQLEFEGIKAEIFNQPPFALGYLVPEGAGLGFIWINPNAEPYEIDMVNDSIIFEPVFVGDGGEILNAPKENRYAIADIIVDMEEDRPPPIDYNFSINPAGYVFDEKQDKWVLTSDRALSNTLFGTARQLTDLATKDNLYTWMDEGNSYYMKDPNNIFADEYIQPTTISVNARSDYFFVASLYEWNEGLLETGELDNENPKNWRRTGTIETAKGTTYTFDSYAAMAKMYVVNELEDADLTLEKMKQWEENDYKNLCINKIYPLYVKFIKEEIAPWYPI